MSETQNTTFVPKTLVEIEKLFVRPPGRFGIVHDIYRRLTLLNVGLCINYLRDSDNIGGGGGREIQKRNNRKYERIRTTMTDRTKSACSSSSLAS